MRTKQHKRLNHSRSSIARGIICVKTITYIAKQSKEKKGNTMVRSTTILNIAVFGILLKSFIVLDDIIQCCYNALPSYAQLLILDESKRCRRATFSV